MHPRITQSDRLQILGVTCATSHARSKVSQKEGKPPVLEVAPYFSIISVKQRVKMQTSQV